MEPVRPEEKCLLQEERESRLSPNIPRLARELAATCASKDCFDHVGPTPIPDRRQIIGLLVSCRDLLFPGYFTREPLEEINLEYHLGQGLTRLYHDLATQVTHAIRHDCFRYDLPCSHCRDRGREAADGFLKHLPELRRLLALDVRAARQGDPASKSVDEVIFSYPGLFAIMTYRLAHALMHEDVPLLPRIMTEYAHSRTGIDIHPGAEIGESFFIDHGTGVVVGETTVIGDRVRIYQGVTLGALSLPPGAGETMRGLRRHPAIEDDVIIYSGATILGGDTVIGARSVIGGNVWITESVPPDTKVFLKRPELIIKGQRGGKP